MFTILSILLFTGLDLDEKIILDFSHIIYEKINSDTCSYSQIKIYEISIPEENNLRYIKYYEHSRLNKFEIYSKENDKLISTTFHYDSLSCLNMITSRNVKSNKIDSLWFIFQDDQLIKIQSSDKSSIEFFYRDNLLYKEVVKHKNKIINQFEYNYEEDNGKKKLTKFNESQKIIYFSRFDEEVKGSFQISIRNNKTKYSLGAAYSNEKIITPVSIGFYPRDQVKEIVKTFSYDHIPGHPSEFTIHKNGKPIKKYKCEYF